MRNVLIGMLRTPGVDLVNRSRGYPMVWCGAILPLMHRRYFIHCDKTRTRPWYKAYEDLHTIDEKMT